MSVLPDTVLLDHFLYPSTVYASNRASQVQTILGSCVSVCMYDCMLHIGGINHFMLPWWNGQGIASPRYGDVAFRKLIEKMQSFGSARENLVAKIFGGADQYDTGPRSYNIGARNVAIAESILAENSINILARSTGGTVGRKIIFNTATNQVLVKKFPTVSYYGERN